MMPNHSEMSLKMSALQIFCRPLAVKISKHARVLNVFNGPVCYISQFEQ